MFNQRLEQLKKQASKLTKQWKPNEGDGVGGVIVRWHDFVHPTFGAQQSLIIDDGYSDFYHCVHLSKYLADQLVQLEAVQGDLCAITFHGKETSKAGNPFNRYSIAVAKQ